MIDVYSVMRNEIEILPYFLRHYGSFADRIFIWDDASDDGTRQMLLAHEKVKLLKLDKCGLDDLYRVEQLFPQYRTISRGRANWAIFVDADEFVYHPNLLQVLEDCRAAGKLKINCLGYCMFSKTFPKTTGQIYDEIKYGIPDKRSTKTVIINPEVDIRWTEGRHKSWVNKDAGINHTDTGIMLLHFRFLGMEYHLMRNRKNTINLGVSYETFKKYNMPDGSRTVPEKWYKRDFSDLIRVVE